MATQPEDDFEEEEVDVEELVKQGKRVPRAKRYRIRIDKERFVVTTPLITKAELLNLVGKTADKWRIHQKLRGGQMDEVTDSEKVGLGGGGCGAIGYFVFRPPLCIPGGAGGAPRPAGVQSPRGRYRVSELARPGMGNGEECRCTLAADT